MFCLCTPTQHPQPPGLFFPQGESKRITLVLQQPQGGSGPPGQRHVVLGSLPGKIVLQGNQLAALSQAKGAPGQPAKVVTIQLQVQQPQGGGQPGAPQKIQLLQQSPATSTTGQPPQPPVAVSSVQQAQVVGSTGQRLTVPLKVVLQPQVNIPAGALGSPTCDASGAEGVEVGAWGWGAAGRAGLLVGQGPGDAGWVWVLGVLDGA